MGDGIFQKKIIKLRYLLTYLAKQNHLIIENFQVFAKIICFFLSHYPILILLCISFVKVHFRLVRPMIISRAHTSRCLSYGYGYPIIFESLKIFLKIWHYPMNIQYPMCGILSRQRSLMPCYQYE